MIGNSIINGVKGAVSGIFGSKDEEDKPVFEEDLVAFVEKEYKRRQDERRPYEVQWRLNLAMFEGNQYLDINTASWNLEEQPILYDWQEREVFNHIAPNIETRIAKLKRMRVIPKVRTSGSTDREDVHSAKIGTQLLKNNYNDRKIRDKQAEEILWLELCGTVFRKHIWNPDLGRVIGVRSLNQEGMAEDADALGDSVEAPGPAGEAAAGDLIEVREGDQEIVVVPPQEIYPDSSYCRSMDDCRSLIHAKAFHTDDIKEIWGIEVSTEKAEAEKLQRMMLGLGGLGYGQGGFMLHPVKMEDHAIVKEYEEKPSKKYPQGRLIIVAGGKLLHSGPMPYMVDDDGKPGFPFSMVSCLDRPGVFWGKTVLERLIPIQRRYNALRNRKAEYLNRCAIGQWTVEEDATDIDKLEQEAGMPGAIHVYSRGSAPPRMVDNPTLPASFETEEHTLLNEFTILSGISEVSRQSGAPPGVKSGVALALVQEQDTSRLSNTAENIERFNIASAKIQLRLFKQYVNAPRTLTATGKNDVAEVIDWIGNDLRSENIYVDSIDALTESIAQKRQMVFDLLGTNLLVDPETGRMDKEMRSKVLDMIEMGEWENAGDMESLHISKAERENKAMEQGQMQEPVDYDEHILHISVHNRFRLTVDYETLKMQIPGIEQVFEAHINMHMMYLQQTAQMMAESQMAAQMQAATPEEGI